MNAEDGAVIEQLLDRWEEERLAGRVPDLIAICRASPQLLPVLEKQVQALQQMERLLEDHGANSPGHEGPTNAPRSVESGGRSTLPAGSIVSASATFRVISAHARGGLGEVLLAQDEKLPRRVALKRMNSDQSSDPIRRRRFLREAEITGRLDHPGIVSILGVAEEPGGNPCYAMQFVSGDTLAEHTRKLHQQFSECGDPSRKNFESAVIRPLMSRFISICNTIAYAHSQDIIHRDIKPANILLGDFGATFVVDWGLARIMNTARAAPRHTEDLAMEMRHPDETLLVADARTSEDDKYPDDDALTHTGAVMGTPAFMSPEQAEGRSDRIGRASDVYSLGATLYFILTGQAPLTDHDGQPWIERLRTGNFARPREVQRLVPASLEAVCLKAMALNPAERYSDPRQISADLERWLADEPVSALRESVSVRLARLARRHRVWTQSLATATAIVAIGAIVFSFLLNAQKNIARSAQSQATMLAEQKSKLAEQEAAARKIADEQSQLSLSTLKSVVFSISRRLRPVAGAAEIRQSLLKTAIDGLNRVARTLETRTDADRNLMIAHNDIGATYLLAGDAEGSNATAEALKHYLRANDIGQKLAAENPDDAELQRDLSVSWEKIGDVQLQQGDVVLAEVSYMKSLLISESQITLSPDDPDLRRDVAFGYEKLGDVRIAREQIPSAREAFERSQQLYEANVVALPKNATVQRDLLVLRSRLGNILVQEGKLDKAEAIFRQCLETCAALEGIPKSGAQPRDRSVMLNKLAGVLQRQQRLDDATAAFQEGLEIARAIQQTAPDDVTAIRDVSVSLNNLGDVQQLSGNLEAARENYSAGLEIRRGLLARDDSSVVAKTDVAQCLLRLGELESKATHTGKARQHLTDAATLLQPLKDSGSLQSAADQLLEKTVQEKLSELGHAETATPAP